MKGSGLRRLMHDAKCSLASLCEERRNCRSKTSTPRSGFLAGVEWKVIMGKMRRLAILFLLIGTTLVAQNAKQVPSFKVDPLWPKPLPNRWLVGAVAGVALDSKDHVW